MAAPLPNVLLQEDPVMSALPVRPELQHIHDMYKKAEGAFWTVDEVDFGQDRHDWETKLTEAERGFLGMVFAFFSASDIIVNNNLAETFLRELKPFVVRRLLAFQMMMENIHSETYAITIDVLVPDKDKKLRLLDALREVPAVREKAAWCDRWSDPATATLGERLVAWACVEGIFFSGSFCALFWLKSRNLMPGATFSNELISRDEGLHRETSVALFHLLPEDQKPSPERCLEIVASAVRHETAFIGHALPQNLAGMNADLMGQYIQCVADNLLRALRLPNHFGTHNPFPFMDMISLPGKTNFFEKRVGEYAKARVARNQGAEDAISFHDEEF
jgi:ribonucleotide reductase beta subunit family protein with ferritin-like domain